MRAAFITMGLTVSYDTTKEMCVQHQVLNEGTSLHIVASVISGVTASILCAPADLVKSKMMAAPDKYARGPLQCAAMIVKKEGLRGKRIGVYCARVRACALEDPPNTTCPRLPVRRRMRSSKCQPAF